MQYTLFTYTTWFHKVLNFVQYIAILLGSFYLFSLTNPDQNQQGFLINSIVYILSLLISFFIFTFILPDNLACYLYVRIILRTKMTYREVKQVSFLFNGVRHEWYPLTEIRDYSVDVRKYCIEEIAKIVQSGKKPVSPLRANFPYIFLSHFKG
ncbi:MAG: hypothetical protein P4L35_03125 [Ignavibacteriaceae bacterium]|nr:hypothetical protein [Ignavibacteriaceae bacterium]